MTMTLCFDSIEMDLIVCASVEEALDILANHSRKFEEQNVELQNDWFRLLGKTHIPAVTIKAEF
jgi:hypothetical protein